MKSAFRRFDLQLKRRWAIASRMGPGGGDGVRTFPVAFLELTDAEGCTGVGEAAPSSRYAEDIAGCLAFFEKLSEARLSFADPVGSMARVEALVPGHFTAKCAVNVALLDGAAQRAGVPVYDWLGLGFRESAHVTSFSLGLDEPEVMREKAQEAAVYPVLKLKVGGPQDRENLRALREAAPTKPVRVDANEAWKTPEEALRQLEWLAEDGHIQFVEQPMPAGSRPQDLAWLKARSPLPLMADESYTDAAAVERVAAGFHAVNVKLVKVGGIQRGLDALRAARACGLKTMLGCMIESSVLISAAAHLAEWADYLDLDGNLLIGNDPYRGVTSEGGRMSFVGAPVSAGLRVAPR